MNRQFKKEEAVDRLLEESELMSLSASFEEDGSDLKKGTEVMANCLIQSD